MLAKVYSCAVIGLDGALVEVEVDIARGLPAFNLAGIPRHAFRAMSAGGMMRLQDCTIHSGIAYDPECSLQHHEGRAA